MCTHLCGDWQLSIVTCCRILLLLTIAELQLKPPWDFEGSIFTVLPGCWPNNPATMKGTNLHLFQKFCYEVVHFFCILVLPSTFIKSTAFTLPKCFTISPLIHHFTHQWQQLTMRGTGQAIGSNARFRASPKDTLTCGHEEPGITLSILPLKDDSRQHLYLPSQSRPVLLKLLAT